VRAYTCKEYYYLQEPKMFGGTEAMPSNEMYVVRVLSFTYFKIIMITII
jgi:hypothetical protein